MILLSLFLLSMAASNLRADEVSQKPSEWERRLEMLRSVPYIAFSEMVAKESAGGVVHHNPGKAYLGYNFYCTRSSGEAFLLDMEGRVVHRWRYPPKKGLGSDHAVLLENGDLAVIKKDHELLRLSWDSRPIWKKELVVHHDVAQAPDGSFYVIVREQRLHGFSVMVQERTLHKEIRVWFDSILHLKAHGEEICRWSTFDHLAELKDVLNTRSFLDVVLDSALSSQSPKDGKSATVFQTKVIQEIVKGRYDFDFFHLNTVSVLQATSLGDEDTRFRQGNLLVCFRNVNQVAVLEQGTYRVLWAWGEGELEWPHHPTMLDDGHILIFDNGVQREYSRVVELDPLAGTIIWEYKSEPPENFYSKARGSAQRLPNGNTLICESDEGRVFEVTEQGSVVWMWLNPVTQKEHRETIYRMLRLPSADVDKLRHQSWWWE
jgi:hypothetical protein